MTGTASVMSRDGGQAPTIQHGPDIGVMIRSARKASELLKALSHESRLLLLCLLAEQERSVGELENLLAMRQPTVSQQLARLRYDGLVTTRRNGKAVYYSIASDDVRDILMLLYRIYCQQEQRDAAPGGA